jgi:tRNA (cytidine/uridine-2'-O-)-methyltransferase
MDIVLVHPQIPWNTGNVGRTCVSTQTRLHLVEPLGYTLDDRQVKRAGLDYWQHLDLTVHPSLDAFLASSVGQRPMVLFSRFATRPYWEVTYTPDTVLVFGSETQGLPDNFKKARAHQLVQIPMGGPVRSLNLSTSVGIGLFEAIRQTTHHAIKA